MKRNVDLRDLDVVGILYLLSVLHSPDVFFGQTYDCLAYARENMADTMAEYVKAIAAAPIFRDDDEADFMVALVLLQYDHDQYCRYLTLLYRFCSLVAKSDGSVTTTEQNFLNHITQLRGLSNGNNVTLIEPTEKQADIGKLNQLIGLEGVKQEVRTMYNFIRIQQSRQKNGLKTSPVSYHCVFTGNPGTGKTTVARILAGIYKELGVIEKGHLVETDRSGLVAEYVGQTAVKTNRVIDKALGGVLFIDEAYSLISADSTDYGSEAIATLLKRMEDDRDKLVVILAGYNDEMRQFIGSNPGLQSRFNRYIHFPDYSPEELHQIFCLLVKKYDYDISEDVSSAILAKLTEADSHKDKNFGNGRYVRNLFEKTLERQANRLATVEHPTLSQLKEIKPDDIW